MCLRSSMTVSGKRTVTQQPQQPPPSLPHDGINHHPNTNTAKSVSFGESTTVACQTKRTSRSLFANHKTHNKQGSSNNKSASWKADHYMNNRAIYMRFGLLVSVIYLWTMLGSIASSFGSTKTMQFILGPASIERQLPTDHAIPTLLRRLQARQAEIIGAAKAAPPQSSEEKQQKPKESPPQQPEPQESPVHIVTHMAPNLDKGVVKMTTAAAEIVTAAAPKEEVTTRKPQVTEPAATAITKNEINPENVVVKAATDVTPDNITVTKGDVDPKDAAMVMKNTPAKVATLEAEAVVVDESVPTKPVVVKDHLDSDEVAAVAKKLAPPASINTLKGDRGKDFVHPEDFIEALEEAVVAKERRESNSGEVTLAKIVVDIPSQFTNDRDIFGYDQHWERASFPRWDLFPKNYDDSISLQQLKDSYKISIMDSTIHFIKEQMAFLSKFDYSVKERDQKLYYDLLWNVGWTNNVHTTDHSDVNTPSYWQPEALYVVDGDKGVVMTSALTKEISNTDGWASTYKYSPTERIMSVGLNILFNKDDNNEMHETIMSRWPRLHEIIVENHSSFPFLAHYSDFVGCNYHNWNGGKESLPLFTVAGNVNCNHTFPFPAHTLSFDARYSPQDWYRVQKKWNNRYGPWVDKKSQVVWRGSLTGKMPKEVEKRAPRWHLLKKVHDDTQLSKEQQHLFDVKLTYITEYAQFEWIKAEELGGANQSNTMIMDDFQQYKAILDVDGHSWSSRFAQLMCYSSVILKVEPQYVDYYYYPVHMDDPYTPQPWKHFIPVKSDMSDLEEKAAYAVDPTNEAVIRRIIQNANDWCANKLTIQSLGMDALDIWEKYVRVLDQSTELKNIINSERLEAGESKVASHVSAYEPESWVTQWNQMKYEIYNGILQMVPVNPAW